MDTVKITSDKTVECKSDKEETDGAGTGALGFANERGEALRVANSPRGPKEAIKESIESIGSLLKVGNDVNAVVSGEVRKGVVVGVKNATSAISGIGAGGGTTADGKTAGGVYGVGGETGYVVADYEEKEVRNRGNRGRSE